MKIDASEILVLINRQKDNYFPEKLDYCKLLNLYKSNSLFSRVFRKIILKFNIIPLEKVIFKTLIKYLNSAKYIILFDTGNAAYLAKLIKKISPNIKLIIWYWNPVGASIDLKEFSGLDIEIWSFDPNDCKKHGLKYNTQFFIEKNLEYINNSSKCEQDVFYVGVDKDRSKILSKLKNIFDKEHISYKFNLVKNGNKNNDYGIEYCEPLEYKDVLNNISQSKAVIDLVAEGQNGLTLRPLEALFLKKKLITNMLSIKEYDFYSPENIFIIGEDDDTKLKEFLCSGYDSTLYDYFCNKYSFKEWINRFLL